MALRELQERRASKAKEANELHSSIEKEDRAWTEDEQSRFDSLTDEVCELDQRIKNARAIETNAAETELAQQQQEERDRFEFNRSKRADDYIERVKDETKPLSEIERSIGVSAWLKAKRTGVSPSEAAILSRMGIDPNQSEVTFRTDRGVDSLGAAHRAPRTVEEANEQARTRRSQDAESRAQSVGTNSAGGFTVPDEMMRSLEVALLQFGAMRSVATTISTDTGASLPIPTANDTAQVGEIIAENAAINSQDVTFGQLTLDAYKYSSKYVACSVELLQDSSIDVPGFLGRALGERIGRITNQHFTTGTGTGQPNGVVTAATDSSVTAASATALTMDELISLKHTVDPAYRSGARWMFSDATFAAVKKIKDSQNRPLFLPSYIGSEPGTIDGDPYTINQDVADIASSAVSVLYGDFSKYLIRDVRGITFMRLDELLAFNHQVAFLAFARYDGDLLDAGTNPVKYLTQAA